LLDDVAPHCGLTLVDHGLNVRMLEQDLEILDLEATLTTSALQRASLRRFPEHYCRVANSLGHSDGLDEPLLLELLHLFPSSSNISITKSGRVDEIEIDVV